MENINDFGFSFFNEEEIKKTERDKTTQLVEELRKANEKLLGLRDMIFPVLEELRKSPEKTHIIIPNRAKFMNDLIDKISTYISQG